MTRITGKTIDPGIDQDVITFQIRGIERGRITASDNTLGGGFAIGSSYLRATNPGSTGAGGAVFIPWTLAASGSTDIAIAGGDSTRINILTTGWYSLDFHSDVFPDSGALSSVTLRIYLNGTGSGDVLRDEGLAATLDDFEQSVIESGRQFTAGDWLTFRVQANAATTFGYAETRLSVLRLS